MKTRLTKTLAAVSTAAFLTLGLAACGGGSGSVDAFCESGESDIDNAMDDVDAEDPAAMVKAITDANDKIQDMKAPSEIADDWATLQKGFGELADNLKDVDTSDPEAFSEGVMAAAGTMGSEEFTTASEKVSKYVDENCKS